MVLVAVELVTNAHDHGDGPRTVRLTRSVDPCAIGIEVEDANNERPMLGTSRSAPRPTRGRGLVIVDRVAESWGVRPRAETGGKVVWAETSCAERPCGS